jgi:TrmH family RNA methyltransferase
MLTKNELKFIQSLKDRKVRNAEGVFVAEGKKVVNELLHSNIAIKQIVCLSTYYDVANIPANINCEIVGEKELERLSTLSTANEALAVCYIPELVLENEVFDTKLTLVLDNINDPGNLGTIIRIADWFGIDTIVCSKQTVDVYNPKVVQATMGSITRVKVFYTDLFAFIQQQQTKNKLAIYGAVLGGENIYETKLTNQGFIIIGSESHGISKEVKDLITSTITIPNYSIDAKTESLNAAVATGIICAEFKRQQKFNY